MTKLSNPLIREGALLARCDASLRTCEPSRAGLVAATGLLPVDHPQLWATRDLVASATRREMARRAGESWAVRGV